MPTADTQSSTVSHVDPVDIATINNKIAALETLTVEQKEGDGQCMSYIVNFYQEQPHVLDPHLQAWIGGCCCLAFFS